MRFCHVNCIFDIQNCSFYLVKKIFPNQVFNRERLGQYYEEATFVLSNFISSIPLMVAIALSSGTILYKMVNFHRGFAHYCYFCVNLLCCVAVSEGSTLLVAVMVPNVLMAIGTSAGVIVSKCTNCFHTIIVNSI